MKDTKSGDVTQVPVHPKVLLLTKVVAFLTYEAKDVYSHR